MGLFNNTPVNPFEMFEDEFLMEFDAGGNNNQENPEEELETIDIDDAGDTDTNTDQNDQTEDQNNDDELETLDDNGEEETQEDENQDNNNQDQQDDPTQNQENPDEELETIDDDPDGMETGDGNEEDATGTDGMDDGGMETPENDPHQKLKELESDIFDQLSEQEKEIKKNELKKLFILLIEKSDSIIDLLQEVPKTDDTVRVIDYVINTLSDLKTYLNDYIVNMYDIKTYLQNTVNFQKYLAIFDSVKAITEEIKRTIDETK